MQHKMTVQLIEEKNMRRDATNYIYIQCNGDLYYYFFFNNLFLRSVCQNAFDVKPVHLKKKKKVEDCYTGQEKKTP